MSRSNFPFAAVFAAVSLLGAAGAVQAEGLEDVLATTYNSNPDMMAARAQLRATDEQVPQALSGWRPTVSVAANGGGGRYFNNFTTLIPDNTNRDVLDYALIVTQPIYSGGRTLAQTSQAENAVRAGRAQLAVTEQQVLLSAATAYLDVARDEAIVKLNINNEQVLTRDLEQTRERFRVGELTKTDVAQAEARLAQAMADRIQAEGVLQTSRAVFVAVVGRPAESPVIPSPGMGLPESLDAAKATARQSNPAVIAADWAAKAAKDGVDAIEGELLPSIGLKGTAGRALNEFIDYSQTRTYEGVVTVTVPLYESGSTWARVRAQKQVWGQRLQDYDRSQRDAVQAATQAWETLAAAHARLQSFNAQINANQLALTGVKEEAKVGARTVIEVLNAEQELFSSKVNLVSASHDEVVSSYQLKAAVGQLTAEGLALAVERYDPVQHYDAVRGQWIGQ